MKRAVSLDVLRGLTIFGMVLSATIPFGAGLPAWMFHAQCPPPTYAFNPDVAGISWVDLVFPIFIFCMGAAIPLALSRKVEKGEGIKEIGTYVFSRFFSLVFFAIYIVHILPSSIGTGFLNFHLGKTAVDGYDLHIFTLIGFGLMFPMFMVIKEVKKRRLWRIAGWGGAILLLLFFRWVYHQNFSLHHSDIIILILADVYLLAAIGWYYTRNSWIARFALFGFWAAVQLSGKYTGFNEALDNFTPVSWFFIFRMSYYMLLILPATVVGDMLIKKLKSVDSVEKDKPGIGAAIFHIGLAAFVVWLTIALFARWLLALYISVPILLLAFYLIMKKYLPAYKQMFLLAAYLIFIGLIIEPVEGGIKKDNVTASYMLITSGMSLCLLIFFDYICALFEHSSFVNLFSRAGGNPLLAYVITFWFVFPLFYISFLIGIYDYLFPADHPWIGVLRAFFLVLGALWLVSWMTKKKINWRA